MTIRDDMPHFNESCDMLPLSTAKEDRVMRRILVPVMLVAGLSLGQAKVTPEKEASLKAEVATQIDGMKKQAQVMVDTVFSFGELGFQELETSKYLTSILEKEGFRVERGLAGIPTASTRDLGTRQTGHRARIGH